MLNIYLDDESEKYLLELIPKEQASGQLHRIRQIKWVSR